MHDGAWSAAGDLARASGNHKPACVGLPQSPPANPVSLNSFTQSSHT
jgi:hypothetical protein